MGTITHNTIAMGTIMIYCIIIIQNSINKHNDYNYYTNITHTSDHAVTFAIYTCKANGLIQSSNCNMDILHHNYPV